MPSYKYIVRKNRTNEKGEVLIFIRYTNSPESVLFSTNTKIPIDAWNDGDQVNPIKKSMAGRTTLMARLQKKMLELMDAEKRCIKKDVEPTCRNIKIELAIMRGEFDYYKPIKETGFFDLYEAFVKERKVTMSDGTIRQYRTLKNLLEEFQKHSKRVLTFETMNSDFYNDFLDFMIKKRNYSNNTSGAKMKVLKTFLTWATKKGYPVHRDYKEFKNIKEEVEVVMLNEAELKSTLNLTVNKRLEKSKDLFVFQCLTGLRVSDLQRVDKQHIHNGAIEMKAYKNKKQIRVPLTGNAIKILMKYDYKLPNVIEQTYRKDIKEICRKAKIRSLVEKVKYQGGKKIYTKLEKWKIISTHTAVKTFISLCVKKGIPAKAVAKMTGKSLKVLMDHYYNIDHREIDDHMKQAFRDF